MGHLAHGLLDRLQFLKRIRLRGVAQFGVNQHATVVDAFVNVIVGQFLGRQVAQRLGHGTHGTDILLTIFDELGHQGNVVVECAISAGNRQQPDKLTASMILLHASASKAPDILKRPRRTVGTRLGGCAVELLQIEVQLQDVPTNQPFKRGVMCAYGAGVQTHTLGERTVWRPGDDILIVEGVGHTHDIGAGILRVVVHSRCFKVTAGARLEINPECGHKSQGAIAGPLPLVS